MSRTYSESEAKIINDTLNELVAEGMIGEGPEGIANGEIIGNYFKTNIAVAIARENILLLRPQLKFKSAVQIAADKAAARFHQDDVNAIVAFISKRGLLKDGDNLLINFTAIANWL